MIRRVLALVALVSALALPGAAPAAASPETPVGWAATNGGTTGGAGAPPESVFVVTNRAELKAALANNGNPDGPKVVLVKGTINGNEADDGRLLAQQDYAPGYDIDLYLACWVDGKTWSDSAQPWCKTQRQLKQTGSNAEKAQIQITIPSNTTLAGLGRGARLNGVYLSIRLGKNIIVRNLTLEAPVDWFSSYDGNGSWDARFDAFSVVTGSNLWIHHNTFTDGRFPDSEAPVDFNGEHVQRHDGLLDIEDASDFVTVSHNVFTDHDKSLLIGSGDSRADRDRGHLRITFHHNLFRNSLQRSPRVRFGEVHSFNNVFVGSPRDADYPMTSEALGGHHYFLGMGMESKLVSEYNAFVYDTRVDPADVTVANLKGYQFTDRGSWVNGRRADLVSVAKRKFEAAAAVAQADAAAAGTAVPEWATMQFTTDVGWVPADQYSYRPQRSVAAVTATVLREAGAR